MYFVISILVLVFNVIKLNGIFMLIEENKYLGYILIFNLIGGFWNSGEFFVVEIVVIFIKGKMYNVVLYINCKRMYIYL